MWDINDTQKDGLETYPAWTGTRKKTNKTITQTIFDPSFKDFRPQMASYWFCKLEALKQITGIENLNTSEVTDMNNMFYGCITLPQLDVSKFDTKNVTDMRAMFYTCESLAQLDVSKFDIKNVTNMGHMFYGCTALTSINNSKSTRAKAPSLTNSGLNKAPAAFNVSNFNTANVTDMSYMFADCSSLTTLDLTSFNTEKVTDMRGMFKGCSSLTIIYCNDVWTCSNTEDMFKDCVKLKGATEYDASNNNETMMNPDTGYFTKKNSTGISQTGNAATVKAVYSIDGRRQKELRSGLNIVRMSDGTTRKVMKK